VLLAPQKLPCLAAIDFLGVSALTLTREQLALGVVFASGELKRKVILTVFGSASLIQKNNTIASAATNSSTIILRVVSAGNEKVSVNSAEKFARKFIVRASRSVD
jgi:hypothetical protein